MAAYTPVVWTAGDTVTEAKLDAMVANDQAEDAHAANGYIANNNVSYKGKNSGGTAKDLMKLGTDDVLLLSQIRHQGKTTNATKENVTIEYGWSFIQGDGANPDGTKLITLPTAFSANPIVVISALGAATGVPTSITDFTTKSAATFATTEDLTLSDFLARVYNSSGANLSSTRYYGFSWIAIGVI